MTCESCGAYTWGSDNPLCARCWMVAQPTCSCGHGKHLHWPDSCAWEGYWNALQQRRVHCDCQGFTEKAA